VITEEFIVNKYLGIPFKHRGRNFSGLDCYGLVIKIYEDLGYKIFDLESYDEALLKSDANYFIDNYHKEWVRIEKPKIFDVVLFRNNSCSIVTHCGVVLKEDKFIHCSRKTKGVIVSRLFSNAWVKATEGFYTLRALRRLKARQ